MSSTDVRVRLHSFILFHTLDQMLTYGNMEMPDALRLAAKLMNANAGHLEAMGTLPAYVFIGIDRTDGHHHVHSFSEDFGIEPELHAIHMIEERNCVDPVAVFAVGAAVESFTRMEAEESGWSTH